MDEPTCSVENCGRAVYLRGWCRGHYARWKSTGDLNVSVPIHPRTLYAPGLLCAVNGCERPRKGRDWCSMHYDRWRQHGDPLFVGAGSPLPRTTKICSMDGCEKKSRSHGLCTMHDARLRRHGDPEVTTPLARRPLSEVNYFRVHQRLREARGSASAYQCTCGRPAEQWAWTHGEDPCSFDSYTPMCRSCHKKYDMTPEMREKNRQAAQASWDAARRERHLARIRESRSPAAAP